MRVGILGGTFNPPHNGHLTAACNVQRALALDLVLLIPTNLPPHKALPQGSATTAQRCQMVQLAAQSYPWLQFCDMEIARGGTSYTIDTLRTLAQNPAYTELVLIMGTDMLLSFDTKWKDKDKIAQLATLAVVAREDDNHQTLDQKAQHLRQTLGANIVLVEGDIVEVSSTQLREGGAVETLTPPQVAQFISENQLYQPNL